MALGINDLKRGSLIVLEGQPYIVLSVSHQHIGRGGANVQARLKNLITGKVLDRGLKATDGLEEADITRTDAEFIYTRKGEFWFHESGDPAARFAISEDVVGDQAVFLKPSMAVRAVHFAGKITNVELPIKMEYQVTEAPPNVRGNTAQGGTKQVIIETGAKIATPMFIETGDVIRVNTQTGEYVERA